MVLYLNSEKSQANQTFHPTGHSNVETSVHARNIEIVPNEFAGAPGHVNVGPTQTSTRQFSRFAIGFPQNEAPKAWIRDL
jgi:hypothetical protein